MDCAWRHAPCAPPCGLVFMDPVLSTLTSGLCHVALRQLLSCILCFVGTLGHIPYLAGSYCRRCLPFLADRGEMQVSVALPRLCRYGLKLAKKYRNLSTGTCWSSPEMEQFNF